MTVPVPYSDIPDAITAAISGDTIQITVAGNYCNSTTMDINKNLSIQGTVSGVSIVNQCNILDTPTVTLQNLLFSGVSGQGISIYSSANVTIQGCTFSNKTLGWGLNIPGAATVTITRSLINSNNPGAINFNGSGAMTISNSTIINNAVRGIVIGGGGTLTMQYCLSTNNQVGVVAQTLDGSNITITNSMIMNEGQVGIWLLKQANVTVSHSTISGNYWDNIRAGNDAANNAKGSVITVTNSILNNGRLGILCMGPGITISLTSCIVNYNREYGFYYAYVPAGDNTPCSFYFADSEFSRNTISGFGVGGQYYLSAVTAIRCKFNENRDSGFVTWDMEGNCNTYFSQCEFIMNKCQSFPSYQIYLNTNNVDSGYSVVYIERSKFVDGSGNARALARMRSWSETTIINCIFDEGQDQLWIEGANVRAYHCDFVTTTKNTRNAVHSEWIRTGGDVIINNCIFSGASVAFQTYNNSSVNISGIANLLYNIDTIYTGSAINIGSISYYPGDPKFVGASSGPGTGDFHLQTNSPALYRGINLGIPNDFDGNPRPRPIGTSPDIGAYEEQTAFPATGVPIAEWIRFEFE
ncbi:MAG: right-handed parallel beta-helix repeat-containing protein [bacterium]|nr:right-handed parallel beta-helix repeat-containing protein [bacterium]